jgi:hypothetical protein
VVRRFHNWESERVDAEMVAASSSQIDGRPEPATLIRLANMPTIAASSR